MESALILVQGVLPYISHIDMCHHKGMVLDGVYTLPGDYGHFGLEWGMGFEEITGLSI